MQVDKVSLTELAQELVRANSSNPPGNEAGVVDILERRMKAAGLQTERVEVAAGRPNLIATWKGKGNKTLILHGHTDTVPAASEGWKHPPFGGAIEGNKLYGRGAADMKGGLAALVAAIESLRKEGWQPKGNLVFLAAANEEMGDKEKIGMRLVAPLMANRHGGERLVIMGDTSGLNITVAEKGVLWIEATAKGKEAHGSTPWKGINAIEKLGKFLMALRELELPVQHPLLGKSTVSINTISGGYKTNIVPGSAKASVDIRIVPGESKEKVFEAMNKLLAQLKQKDPEIDIDIKETMYEPPAELEGKSALPQLQAAIKEVTGHEAKVRGEHGSSGSGMFQRAGIPALVFGPGLDESAHIRDEYVEIEQLAQAAAIYAGFAKRWLG
jgi:succinyl-diaminopimelate desuccinylase